MVDNLATIRSAGAQDTFNAHMECLRSVYAANKVANMIVHVRSNAAHAAVHPENRLQNVLLGSTEHADSTSYPTVVVALAP